MKIFFLAVLLLTSACTTKQNVVYSSHWQQQWQSAIEQKCKNEAQVVTFSIIDAKLSAGESIMMGDIDRLEKMLLHSCLKYYGLFI